VVKLSFLIEFLHWLRYARTPKDKALWVFGAIRGTKYLDNAKYLFEYIHHHTDIEVVWISKNHEVVSSLQAKGYKAYHEESMEAKHYASQAKVAVITHRGNRKKADIPMHYFSKETMIVQLWHGIPLKKIAYDDKIFSFDHDEKSLFYQIKNRIKSFFPFLTYVNRPLLIPALSQETQQIFAQAFRVPKKRVVITGYPRNDILIRNAAITNTSQIKKIIYMPTFRGEVNSHFDLFLQYGFDVERIDRFLASYDMQLDIKLHPFNRPSKELLEHIEASKHIMFLECDDIYEILHQYHILMTDYSSIYFDYLLLDRPIIFTPFDQESYIQNDREFYFDYENTTPGPKAMNWVEVLEYLKRSLQDPSYYAKDRETIKNRFHTYQDAKSTQRVYKAILEMIAQEKQ